VCAALFDSVSRLQQLVSPPFAAPEFDGGCLGRNATRAERDRRSTSGDAASAMHRVDVSRFIVAGEGSSATAHSPRRHVDHRSDAGDVDPTATSYVRLDVLRVALAVVDLFIVLHRCACLGCCGCYRHADGQLVAETRSSVVEVMRNGLAAGDSVVVCSKHHDGTARPGRHGSSGGRAPNGSAARPPSSFDVYDVEENIDDVPDGPRLLRRHRRRGGRGGKGGTVKAALRRRDIGDVERCRPTHEQRRRRRQLVALLTRLVLCSIVVSLVYVVVRSLDVVLADLLTVAAKHSVVSHLLVAEIFLSDTAARQVRRIKVKCLFVWRFIMSNSPLRRSGVARVNERSHSFTCHPHVYPQVA